MLIAGSTAHAKKSAQKSEIPDFAYPKTVITNSESSLKSSLAAGNDIEALRALMDYALAQGSIGSENLPAAIDKVKETEPKLKSDGAKAFAKLLLADMYRTIFNANSYVYNNRQLPLTPLPADYTEWSGDQFRAEILKLCNAALSNPEALQCIDISDYSKLVTMTARRKYTCPRSMISWHTVRSTYSRV